MSATPHRVHRREVSVPILVEEILSGNTELAILSSIDGCCYVNGDSVVSATTVDLLALVRGLLEVSRNAPPVVVVFRSVQDLSLGDERNLREKVVHAGGILSEVNDGESFSEAVRRWEQLAGEYSVSASLALPSPSNGLLMPTLQRSPETSSIEASDDEFRRLLERMSSSLPDVVAG